MLVKLSINTISMGKAGCSGVGKHLERRGVVIIKNQTKMNLVSSIATEPPLRNTYSYYRRLMYND
jgi:hypothetical protein